MTIEKSKKETRIIAICIAIIIVIGAVAGFWVISKSLNKKTYQVKIEEGKKYFSDGDFDNAILAYQAALDANSESEEAYVGLAKTYEEKKDYSSAKNILRQGINKINSAQLNKMLAQINFNYFGIGDGVNMDNSEIASRSENVTLNKTFWASLKAMTYKDFNKKYHDASMDVVEKGLTKITYPTMMAACYYDDLDNMNSSGKPNDNAYPGYVELMDLGMIFDNINEVISYDRLKSIFNNNISIQYDDVLGCDAIRAGYDQGFIVIKCDRNGNILSQSASNYIMLGNESIKNGELSGKVTDAVTNDLVTANITVIPKGGGASDAIKSKSNSSGKYSLQLSPGKYILKVTANNYIDTELEVVMPEEDEALKKDIVMSPQLNSGEIRIVLQWGSSPRDLDSYLFDDANHKVSFSHKKITDGNEEIASLDLDDRNGFGPETITIKRNDRNFSYVVNDYGHESNESIQNSKATVTVYVEGKEPQVIEVPSGSGNVWEVVNINKGEIEVVNRISTWSTSPYAK